MHIPIHVVVVISVRQDIMVFSRTDFRMTHDVAYHPYGHIAVMEHSRKGLSNLVGVEVFHIT